MSTEEWPEIFEQQIVKAQAALREQGRAEAIAEIVADLRHRARRAADPTGLTQYALGMAADRYAKREHLAKTEEGAD